MSIWWQTDCRARAPATSLPTQLDLRRPQDDVRAELEDEEARVELRPRARAPPAAATPGGPARRPRPPRARARGAAEEHARAGRRAPTRRPPRAAPPPAATPPPRAAAARPRGQLQLAREDEGARDELGARDREEEGHEEGHRARRLRASERSGLSTLRSSASPARRRGARTCSCSEASPRRPRAARARARARCASDAAGAARGDELLRSPIARPPRRCPACRALQRAAELADRRLSRLELRRRRQRGRTPTPRPRSRGASARRARPARPPTRATGRPPSRRFSMRFATTLEAPPGGARRRASAAVAAAADGRRRRRRRAAAARARMYLAGSSSDRTNAGMVGPPPSRTPCGTDRSDWCERRAARREPRAVARAQLAQRRHRQGGRRRVELVRGSRRRRACERAAAAARSRSSRACPCRPCPGRS